MSIQGISLSKYINNVISNRLGANLTDPYLVEKGVIDCSANPNYPVSQDGWLYFVSVAGKIGGVSGVTVDVGDLLICVTNSATGTYAEVGSNFRILQTKLQDASIYKGVIDCSTNPNYPASNAGEIWVVSVAGKIGGGSGIDVVAGDLLFCKVDNTASGTSGTNWQVIQSKMTTAVLSAEASTDNAVARYDLATGKLLQNSKLILGDDASLGIARNASTHGEDLTLYSGGAKSGGSNLDAGDILIKTGLSTGTGHSNIKFQTTTQGGSGIADNTLATRIELLDNKIGFFTATPVVRPTALTAQLTTITHTAPSSEDFAFANTTNTTPWGFSSQDEANTLLKVVANLQIRLALLEQKLKDLGLLS